MTSRRIWLIADDYGLSPGVGRGILDLLQLGRLSGTGCMTLFPEWPQQAKLLREVPADVAIGLHLTLTDQMAASGRSALAPNGRLPPLGKLAALTRLNPAAATAATIELDAQYNRFVHEMGRAPDFVDGHQHIHFLPVVRRWLATLRTRPSLERLPFVRGAPSLTHAPRRVFLKAAVVRGMAWGFDRFLRSRGFPMLGPLAGFYDWSAPNAFASAWAQAAASLPDGALFMCHPGVVDPVLVDRDRLQEPRIVELQHLRSDAFGAVLTESGATVARMAR